MTRNEEAAARRKSIIEILRRKELMGTADISEQLGIEKPMLMRDMAALVEEGLVSREGKGPGRTGPSLVEGTQERKQRRTGR